MPQAFTIEAAYKISAIFGTAIVLFAPFFSWTHIVQLEPRATQTFERYILADLDKRSLSEQLASIEYAIRQSANGSEIAVNYSAGELQTLAREAELLRGQIEQQLITLKMLDAEKHSIIAELKLTIAGTIIVLAVGMVFAVFGFIAWYFHIQILEDRRNTLRE